MLFDKLFIMSISVFWKIFIYICPLLFVNMGVRMWKSMERYLIVLLMWMFPLSLLAEETKQRIPEKPLVPDSILQNIFQFSPFYSRIVDEYKADVYLKGRVKVHKSNRLVRYIPSMFRLEKGVNDYIIESMSEMHYTAPDIYNRKVKAISSTFPRHRGELTDMTDFLNMNIYSSSIMTDKLLSPLDKESAKYYTYILDTIAGSDDCRKYKIQVIPKFKGTQLVNGYIWVSDEVWTIREVYFEGKFDMIDFKLRNVMGEEGNEEFLPVQLNLDIVFKFMGNHLEMNADAWVKYDMVQFYKGGERRKSQKKHSHDLTEFYELTCDSSQVVTDRNLFDSIRPIPLNMDEYSLYQRQMFKKNHSDWIITTKEEEKEKAKKNSAEFWGALGDALVSSYNINLAGIGSVRCSPLINPVMLDYSHSRGISYKQRFKYNRLFPNEQLLRVVPQVGYNFSKKELYVKGNLEYQYWPQKLGAIEVSAGNGNRIYSSVVLDKLSSLPDSSINFKNLDLDYFKDIYLDVFHSIEPVNGLLIKAGATMHWRSLIKWDHLDLADFISQAGGGLLHDMNLRTSYNSFAPRIRIEWTPGMYYYMNGKRKMNVGSSMPTFILDYERGLKGVFGSNDEHERVEFDVQQKIKLNQIRTLSYRTGFGLFTKMDNIYFVDYVNFRRSNIPEGWNDEIGGTFQLLDRQWFNSARRYWRGHVTYESPFILLRPLNRWLGMIQQERLYGGVLFMPHLKPYVELGYGIGTHIFDVGAFVSSMNGKFDTVGFKFTFELFND